MCINSGKKYFENIEKSSKHFGRSTYKLSQEIAFDHDKLRRTQQNYAAIHIFHRFFSQILPKLNLCEYNSHMKYILGRHMQITWVEKIHRQICSMYE